MLSTLLVAGLLLPAAGPTPGTYRVESDHVSVRKEVWSIYCDMKADKIRSSRGETVVVEEREGGHWIARGSTRLFGTGQCEAQNKGLAPESAPQKRGGKVVMKCRSARVTLGTEASEQKVWSTKDAIWFQVNARRTFRHRGDDCISVLDRRTKAVLVEPAAGAEPPPEEPADEEREPDEEDTPAPPADPCEKPGSPAKLIISPRVAVAKIGEEPACFEVSAEDDNGCVTKAGPARFEVEPAKAGRIDDKGCFRPSRLRAEQLIAVVAEAGGLDVAASVRVIPKGEEKSKRSLQALAKASKSKRVQEVIGEVTRGAFTIRPLETEPEELPPLEPAPFPWAPVGGAAGLALVASIAGLLFARRRKASLEVPTDLQAAPVVTPTKGGGLVCPQCAFEFAVGEATHCPFDGTELTALERDARQTMFVPAAGGMVCPKCKTKYPTKARFCGHDRTPLVPDFGQLDDQS